MKAEDVTIELLRGRLTISGESVDRQFEEGTRRCIRELPDGKFSRVLTAPLGMNVCQLRLLELCIESDVELPCRL